MLLPCVRSIALHCDVHCPWCASRFMSEYGSAASACSSIGFFNMSSRHDVRGQSSPMPHWTHVQVGHAMDDWRVGDQFHLAFLHAEKFRHRFWSHHPGHPDSRVVRRCEFSVPHLDEAFEVELLCRAWHVRSNRWYVAALTQYGLWTNLQAGDDVWVIWSRAHQQRLVGM